MARLLWPKDLQAALGPPAAGSGDDNDAGAEPSFSWMVDLHHSLLLPVSLPVGLVSGYGLHATLGSLLLGANKARPWTVGALPLLAGVTGLSAFYFARCGSYDASALFWEPRVDVRTGKAYSYNVRTGERAPGAGRARNASVARGGADLFCVLRGGALKWLGWAWDDATSGLPPTARLPAEDHLVSVGDLERHGDLHLLLDLLVRLKHLQLAEEQVRRGAAGKADDVSGAMAAGGSDEDDDVNSGLLGSQPGVQPGAQPGAQPASAPSGKAALVEAARATHRVDLAVLLKGCEMALLSAERAAEATRLGKAAQADRHRQVTRDVVGTLYEGVLPAGLLGEGRASARGRLMVAELATHGLPLLRRRLKDDLGFSVGDADATTRSGLDEIASKGSYQRWFWWLYSTGITPFLAGVAIAKGTKAK